MKLIRLASLQTHEKIQQLIEQVLKGEITPEERNEIVLSCFKAETARMVQEEA